MSAKRTAIIGGPRSGKTTYAAELIAKEGVSAAARGEKTRPVVHTDDFIALGWEAQPFAVITACQAASDAGKGFILEGVTAARALRKGLLVDEVIYLHGSRVELTPKQDAMRKGVRTVFLDWLKNGFAGEILDLYV